MNSAPTFRLAPLSVGVPRTTVRHSSVWPRRRIPKPELSNFAPGHGEQIWVWSNIMSNQVIYSHTRQLDSNRALRQLPFIAKKSKPAKLRKDLWRPMALIQFPAGAGVVGQSVFQKLREFRRRHELEWPDEMFFKETDKKRKDLDEEGEGNRNESEQPSSRSTEGEEEGSQLDPESPILQVRTKKERGFAIHDQRNNAIADMAAALAGEGRGSRMWISQEEESRLANGEGELIGRRWTRMGPLKTLKKNDTELVKATVYWVDQFDQNFANGWSANVTHELFEDAKGRQSGPLAQTTSSEPTAVEEKSVSA